MAIRIVRTQVSVKSTPMPREIQPMKAVLVDEPFDREGWIFENKWDGIRAIAFIKNGAYRLVSRNQKEMTARYPELVDLSNRVKAASAILDGEIVVINARGNVDFHQLASRFGVTDASEIARLERTQTVIYYLFDLLYLDGRNLMHLPLLERKALLKKFVRPTKLVQLTPHIETKGIQFFKKVERAHGEGMIAKRADSTYQERRSNGWLKVKTQMRQEVVIVGYSDPRGSRKRFGALELGLYQNGVLRSIGQVGTGFSFKLLDELYAKMKPLETTTPTIRDGKRRNDVHWIKPKLVCEVRFSEFTPDGNLRHPAFLGLRADKKPEECKYEIPKHVASPSFAKSIVTKKRTSKEPTKSTALERLIKKN